jgi:cyanophycin synthetase
MEWNEEINLSERSMTSRLIVECVLARKWRICGFKTNRSIFLIYIPGREEPVRIFSASPPQMSYPSVKIAKDKYITNQILNSVGVPTPEELLVNVSSYDQTELEKFMSSHHKIVVKPLDASHGKGITVNIDTLEKLLEAIEQTKKYSTNQNIIIQEQVEGIDARIICINYEFINAYSRVPASVTGDGISSIEELILLTNASEHRGESYKAPLNTISVEQVTRYLGEEELSIIPKAGEDVQVIGVSNLGMGGVRINLADRIPEELKTLAIKAAKTI